MATLSCSKMIDPDPGGTACGGAKSGTAELTKGMFSLPQYQFQILGRLLRQCSWG
jgi:hypothetical protein